MKNDTNTSLPLGYGFGGIHCGIKENPARKDLSLIVSDNPAAAAGVFTQNRLRAAPVQVNETRLPSEAARAVIVCSGNANACTGEQGLADARAMAESTAQQIGCEAEQVLVCSTGIIGVPLPMDVILEGISSITGQTSDDWGGFESAAQGIITTDTRIKTAILLRKIGGREVRIAGISKGAAMIGPNMATMLGFVLSDAKVAARDLKSILRDAVSRSFNCISVEGHMSTNDTVLLLANGAGGGELLQGADLETFGQMVSELCQDLARQIANDAEGISHLITIHVNGTETETDARRIAKVVAESALVKTAIFGADPNWGRIVSAAGYSGVEFEERDLSLRLGGFLLYDKGIPQRFDEESASQYIEDHREIEIELTLTLGSASCRFWTCDMGYEYIRLNAEYTT